MIVNKKLDRFKQWAGERMGGEIKTNVTDNFKALELEMDLRQKGMEKMQESMAGYMKSVSKRTELERKEKALPIAYMGTSMVSHGEDFEHDSEFGACLTSFGRTQERLARSQDSYIVAATDSWLESLERSLVQMKEYQAARKKLESRRLAYDTSLAKLQKAKREDFRVEEELRTQQAKYEEAEADVERRMFEIKDAEADSVNDLTAFLEAQLAYHDRCRNALLDLQNEWPARNALGQTSTRSRPQPARARSPPPVAAPTIRSRSNTVRSFISNHSEKDEPVERPSIRSRTSSYKYDSFADSVSETPPARRPTIGRSTTYQQAPTERRDISPIPASNRLSRVPSDSFVIQGLRSNLRRVDTTNSQDVFGDEYSHSHRSVSPQTPQSTGSQTPMAGRRPPPPPPSRSSKPGISGKAAPPPPPAKRTLIT